MDETEDAVERLCVLIGMIMEDASVVALLPAVDSQPDERLAVLEQASRDIVALAQAGSVIARRWPKTAGC